MLAEPIVRVRRPADSLFGGVGVREFAASEYPREDVHWVVAQVRRKAPVSGATRGRWARFWRPFDTPSETEKDPEAIVEPVAT